MLQQDSHVVCTIMHSEEQTQLCKQLFGRPACGGACVQQAGSQSMPLAHTDGRGPQSIQTIGVSLALCPCHTHKSLARPCPVEPREKEKAGEGAMNQRCTGNRDHLKPYGVLSSHQDSHPQQRSTTMGACQPGQHARRYRLMTTRSLQLLALRPAKQHTCTLQGSLAWRYAALSFHTHVHLFPKAGSTGCQQRCQCFPRSTYACLSFC